MRNILETDNMQKLETDPEDRSEWYRTARPGHNPEQRNMAKAQLAKARTLDHFEWVSAAPGVRVAVTAPTPRNSLGIGYFVVGKIEPANPDRPERTLSIALTTRDPANRLGWSGVVRVPAKDAWTFLRALELLCEQAKAGGLITGERVTKETAL
ncbi:MAG TPA: hypothetical protein VGM82_18875 [Gemmatimonadaceae bacterium]